MDDFERVLEAYMPFVITGWLRNMLPNLIKAVSGREKEQLTEMPMPESTRDGSGLKESAAVENEHDV